MIITYGFIIFVGMAFIFIKLPRRRALWLLGHHMWLDVSVTVLAFLMHFGTFSGVMSAAVAGLMCSIFTTSARWLFGYIKAGHYQPGIFHVEVTT